MALQLSSGMAPKAIATSSSKIHTKQFTTLSERENSSPPMALSPWLKRRTLKCSSRVKHTLYRVQEFESSALVRTTLGDLRSGAFLACRIGLSLRNQPSEDTSHRSSRLPHSLDLFHIRGGKGFQLSQRGNHRQTQFRRQSASILVLERCGLLL